jgi:hypothetical protein
MQFVGIMLALSLVYMLSAGSVAIDGAKVN